jgi:sulfide:quinone oxidoreductase
VAIELVMPFGTPIPPSPETSAAIIETFAERGIDFVPDRTVTSLDPATHEAVLDDGSRRAYDLFLGIPVHRAPAVVEPMTDDGWIAVDQHTLATHFPGVYAVGDVTSVGTPKAGVFAERAARALADRLIAEVRGDTMPAGFDGTGACWIEFGGHDVGRVDVDFFSTPGRPTGTFTPPSPATAAEKAAFGADRRARWFGDSN